MSAAPTIHAGAVVVGEAGLLVRGASGSGKSSLILALVAAAPRSTWLVADDRVILVAAHGRLVASVPAAIAGKLEIRGQAIASFPFVSPAVIRLVVDLAPTAACLRLPSPEEAAVEVLGVRLPRLMLPAGIADGAVRIRAALAWPPERMAEILSFEASCVAESIGQDTAFGAAGGTGRGWPLDGSGFRRGTGRGSRA